MLSATKGRRTVRVHVVISFVESLRARTGQCPRNLRHRGARGIALHEMLLCNRSGRINTEYLLARVDEPFLIPILFQDIGRVSQVGCLLYHWHGLVHCFEKMQVGHATLQVTRGERSALRYQNHISPGQNGCRRTHVLADTVFVLIEWPLDSTTFPKQETRVDK